MTEHVAQHSADDLAALTTDELRGRRDDVRAREQAVSFRRRMLQAQLDMVGAVATANSGEDLAAALGRILADAPSTTAISARSVELDVPLDDVMVAPLPSDLTALDDAARGALLDRLRTEESEASTARRALLDELDTLQSLLVERYRSDGVDTRALLGGTES